MLTSYFQIALRHLWRSRLYAGINVAGLMIGVASVLISVLYILDENSFDRFHLHNPNLYRITTSMLTDGKRQTSGGTGQVQGPAFQAQIPEVLQFNRVMGGDIYGDVSSGPNAFRLQLLFVDDSFFDVFSFKLLNGNSKTVLSSVNSVVLTRRTAMKFFNRLDVVGAVLQMNDDPSARRLGKPLVVSGVVENPPVHSSIQFDVLFPFSFMRLSFEDKSWTNAYLGTFVVLDPRADVGKVEQKFNQIYKIHAKKEISERVGANSADPRVQYKLQPVTDIHLNPQELTDQNREGGIINGSKPIYSYLFLGISSFILLMASINFINVSIADSFRRTREIGVRKVTGSTSGQIMAGHLLESLILCLLAFAGALLILYVLLPVFNELSGKQIGAGALLDFDFMFWSFVVLLINLLASALYPAYLISGFDPVTVLYEKHKISGRNARGSSLVVFQFTMALVLVISTIVFYQQMQFVQQKNLGYRPSQVIQFRVPGLADTRNITEHFSNELQSDSRIAGISLTGGFGLRGAEINGRKFQSYYRSVDSEYVPMLEINMIEGRNFSGQFPDADRRGVLVNEAFVKAAGLKMAVGRHLSPDGHFGGEPFTITGVVGDFHAGSLREKIQPMVLINSSEFGGEQLLAKIGRNGENEAIAHVKGVFNKQFPGAVFDYSYLDENNAAAYKEELRWQKIIGYATVLSIFICCIGLFALGHLSASQRIREIGIRRVLGADVSDITSMFTRGFLKMVMVAILLASPLAYYAMNTWLENFAYRIVIQWWVFALSGGLAILITVVTVGAQALRVASLNPVESIRNN